MHILAVDDEQAALFLLEEAIQKAVPTLRFMPLSCPRRRWPTPGKTRWTLPFWTWKCREWTA